MNAVACDFTVASAHVYVDSARVCVLGMLIDLFDSLDSSLLYVKFQSSSRRIEQGAAPVQKDKLCKPGA